MTTSLLGAPALYEAGLREAAPGIHAWLAPNGDWGESNAALVVGDGAALLVDTLWSPALTGRMLEAMRGVSECPITTLVNTHSDGDHTWGNELLAGAEIVSTRVAAQIIRHEPPAAMARNRALAPWLARLPGVGEFGRYLARMLAPYDFASVNLTPPTREFSGSLTLDAGGRAVELYEVGPAHTPGDLIVHVPDAAAVIAADIVFVGVHPVMWAGPTSNWIAALERIEALAPEVVVPGHGPVATLAEVALLRDYLRWLEDAAMPRLQRGTSPRDVALALTREELPGQPWEGWIGPERMVITVATIDRHRRGESGAVSAGARARIFREVASVAAATHQPPFAPR